MKSMCIGMQCTSRPMTYSGWSSCANISAYQSKACNFNGASLQSCSKQKRVRCAGTSLHQLSANTVHSLQQPCHAKFCSAEPSCLCVLFAEFVEPKQQLCNIYKIFFNQDSAISKSLANTKIIANQIINNFALFYQINPKKLGILWKVTSHIKLVQQAGGLRPKVRKN